MMLYNIQIIIIIIIKVHNTYKGQEHGDAIYLKCKVCDYSDYSDKDSLSDYIENDPAKYVNLEKYI